MAWSSGSAARSSSCTDVFMLSCRSQIWRKWTYQKLAAAIFLILGTHCAAASGSSLGNRTEISIKCWFGMVLGYPSIFEIHTHTQTGMSTQGTSSDLPIFCNASEIWLVENTWESFSRYSIYSPGIFQPRLPQESVILQKKDASTRSLDEILSVSCWDPHFPSVFAIVFRQALSLSARWRGSGM